MCAVREVFAGVQIYHGVSTFLNILNDFLPALIHGLVIKERF